MAATVMGRRYRVHLPQVLFLMLESLQAPHPTVAAAAAAALTATAQACGYESARALLLANADYTVHAATQRLRHLSECPTVAPVLAVLVQQVQDRVYGSVCPSFLS
jgi:hypothetical protein